MYIITPAENNVVIDIGELLSYNNDEFTIKNVSEMELIYPTDIVNLYEVFELDSKIEIFTYCYSPDEGFYENPNYIEPTEPEEPIGNEPDQNPYGIPEGLVEQIKNDAITEIQQEVTNHVNE